MRKLLVALLFAGLLTNCNTAQTDPPSTTEETSTPPESTPAEETETDKFADFSIADAYDWIGEGEGVQIIDVRTPDETAGGMIPGAIHVDYMGDNFKAELEKLDKSIPTLVYCAAGGRSGKSVPILKELGFTEVHNLLGGYGEWSASFKN